MPNSKKSLVTAVRRGHLMNSVFVNSGTYSCAVDTFMELSAYLFLPHLSNLSVRNEFTDLLFNTCLDYLCSRDNSLLLRDLRDPVWSYIIDHCSSFVARDCNACFSEIFEEKTFGFLNEEEENLFTTLRSFDSICNTCEQVITLNSRIILTVVTINGLNELGLDKNMWPLYVTDIHTRPGRLNCINCHSSTAEPVLRTVSNSKFLFIEFPPELMVDIDVFEEIEVSGAQYNLRGIVRCHNNHFTCGVESHRKWTYFDDLSVNLQEFPSLETLRQVYSHGCFFTIYELKQLTNCKQQGETTAPSVDESINDCSKFYNTDKTNSLNTGVTTNALPNITCQQTCNQTKISSSCQTKIEDTSGKQYQVENTHHLKICEKASLFAPKRNCSEKTEFIRHNKRNKQNQIKNSHISRLNETTSLSDAKVNHNINEANKNKHK